MPDTGDFPPFRPPYELAGSCLAIVGLWDNLVPATPPPGYRPAAIFGRPLGMVVVNHYEEPPKELPIRYHEAIAAQLVRRGLDWLVLPFDMVLDEPVPVDMGQTHYGLPKRFDAGMSADILSGSPSVHASGVTIEARTSGALLDACALPIRIAFTLGVRVITSMIDVCGTEKTPPRRARIALRPRGLGRMVRVKSATFGGVGLRSIWCQSWRWTSTWLGPPSLMESK